MCIRLSLLFLYHSVCNEHLAANHIHLQHMQSVAVIYPLEFHLSPMAAALKGNLSGASRSHRAHMGCGAVAPPKGVPQRCLPVGVQRAYGWAKSGTTIVQPGACVLYILCLFVEQIQTNQVVVWVSNAFFSIALQHEVEGTRYCNICIWVVFPANGANISSLSSNQTQAAVLPTGCWDVEQSFGWAHTSCCG